MQSIEIAEKICLYCEKSVNIIESDVCVCKEHGAVASHGSCRKFKLDPLKIDPVPRKLPDTQDLFFTTI